VAAICLRCGAPKSGPQGVCAACGHNPQGEGQLVAWLLSDAHLSPPELLEAAARIQRGLSPRPSARMLDLARRTLGVHVDLDPGLSGTERVGLMLLGLAVSPAPGLAMAWTWWNSRPRAARQALGLSAPSSVIATGFFFYLLFGR
jgi:hypothetical protein